MQREYYESKVKKKSKSESIINRHKKTGWKSIRFKCWHYLSSRQVTLQVLWARVSLTSVFGMGTGGPSPQSIPTLVGGFLPPICQSALRSNSLLILAPFLALVKEILVTRTGFEPMLKA